MPIQLSEEVRSLSAAPKKQKFPWACDEPQERAAPLPDGTQAQIVPIEARKLEGHERGSRAAALGQERPEVAAPILTQRHRFAVEERAVAGEAAKRLGNGRSSIDEVHSGERRQIAPRHRRRFRGG